MGGLIFLHSYLTRQKQNASINNVWYISNTTIRRFSRVITRPIFFNIFINDFCLCLNKPELHDFSDGNTISVVAKYIKELMKTLEKENHRLI